MPVTKVELGNELYLNGAVNHGPHGTSGTAAAGGALRPGNNRAALVRGSDPPESRWLTPARPGAMTSGIHRLFNKNQLFRSKTIYPDSHHIGREAQ
jgi:hypothetical protein